MLRRRQADEPAHRGPVGRIESDIGRIRYANWIGLLVEQVLHRQPESMSRSSPLPAAGWNAPLRSICRERTDPDCRREALIALAAGKIKRRGHLQHRRFPTRRAPRAKLGRCEDDIDIESERGCEVGVCTATWCLRMSAKREPLFGRAMKPGHGSVLPCLSPVHRRLAHAICAFPIGTIAGLDFQSISVTISNAQHRYSELAVLRATARTPAFPVALRRQIGLVRLSGDDRNNRDLRLVQGSALDPLLSDQWLRSRMASTFADHAIKDELADNAKASLADLDRAFAARSLPSDVNRSRMTGSGSA